ncbi:protein kinase [Savitreella phatthalungensis]
MTMGGPVEMDALEAQKENIEPVRGGRRAGALVKAFAVDRTDREIEQARFEKEVSESLESDDPLEVWLRYIAWTHEQFPSGSSATSGYVEVLERCASAFLTHAHYRDDPRYLKVWIEYARYSDDARELFCFLARNRVGAGLALFYEEYAAWLESRGRKGQADEIYQMGLAAGARPTTRLRRKYNEFSLRLAQNPPAHDEPSSPPIAPVRAALTTKFSGAGGAITPATTTVAPPTMSIGVVGKPKMQVFVDQGEASESGGTTSGGWASIGSLRGRRKENTVSVRTMAGEKMSQPTAPSTTAPKLQIFQDTGARGATGGRRERVACDLEAVYAGGEEFSFEELKARRLNLSWPAEADEPVRGVVDVSIGEDEEEGPAGETAPLTDYASPLKDSPMMRPRKRSIVPASPTINTKNAMNDILDLFSQPLKCEQSSGESDDDDDDSEADYDSTYALTQEVSSSAVADTVASEVETDSSESDDDEDIGVVEDGAGGCDEVDEEEDERGVGGGVRDERRDALNLMTPITEDTGEHGTALRGGQTTPSKQLAVCGEVDEDDSPTEPFSSPFIEDVPPPPHTHKPPTLALRPHQPFLRRTPTIPHKLCTPTDQAIRSAILAGADVGGEVYRHEGQVLGGALSEGGSVDVGGGVVYGVRGKVGEGAFAPVYQATVTNVPHPLALKVLRPPDLWESHILNRAARRLAAGTPAAARAAASVVKVHRVEVFEDAVVLAMEMHGCGTVLDLVNVWHAAGSDLTSTTGSIEGVDETLAVFLVSELLRTVENLHAKGILHGDIKADNILLRLPDIPVTGRYRRDGGDGWRGRGVCLCDFGRGVDLRAFPGDASFMADWKPDNGDCSQIRNGEPWTFEIDYHGIANVAHTLLFGRFIETVWVVTASGVEREVLKAGFRRYWAGFWGELFDVLLNGGPAPRLAECRSMMEDWLEQHSERGQGLRQTLRRAALALHSTR